MAGSANGAAVSAIKKAGQNIQGPGMPGVQPAVMPPMQAPGVPQSSVAGGYSGLEGLRESLIKSGHLPQQSMGLTGTSGIQPTASPMSVSDQMQMNRAPLGSDPAQMAARQSGMTPQQFAQSGGLGANLDQRALQAAQPQMAQANTPQQFNTFGGATTRNPIVDGNAAQTIVNTVGQAATGTAAGMGITPINVQASQVGSQGYNAQNAAAQGYTAQQAAAQQATAQGYTAQQAAAERAAAERATAQGYGAERIAGVGPVTSERVQAGQLAGTSLDPYFNPYENQVVQQSLSDLERQRLMQQNLGGAQAQAANAFGGSRQGIAEAETNRAFAEQAARTASGLRQAGFTQAQQAAQQDIATRMQAGLANQATGLQAATTTANLGQQAQMANQAAGNQAAQFGAQAQNVAGLQNAQLGTQAAMQNAQLGTQANLANQAAMNQAAQFGAQAQNVSGLQNAQLGTQAALQNAAAMNQAGQFGAQAQNVAALQNAAAQNQAAQFGAGASNQAALANQQAMMQAQTANQAAGLQAGGQRLQAAGQLANIGNLGFGMVQDVQQGISQAGLAQQAANQALIDAGRAQYAGYTGAPLQALQTQLGAFGGSQTNAQTQTTSKQPGLFDYLQLGASVM